MRYLATLLLTAVVAGPVIAGQCPTLVSQIDTQLQSTALDSETKANIKALRDRGESLHQQGKHDESVKVLQEALSKLDMRS